MCGTRESIDTQELDQQLGIQSIGLTVGRYDEIDTRSFTSTALI